MTALKEMTLGEATAQNNAMAFFANDKIRMEREK